MSNEEIVENIQNGIDVTLNQERLWQQNKGMVYRIIRFKSKFSQDIEDDLAQQGFIGLINAATKYKMGGEGSFLSYAMPFVTGAIYKYMATTYNHFHIPQYMRRRIRLYQDITAVEEMSDEDIAQRLNIPIFSVREVRETIEKLCTYSLYSTEKETDKLIIDTIADNYDLEEMIISSVYEQELHNALTDALGILDDVTIEIIKCVFFLGFSKKRVADMMNCSTAAISGRIERGFNKILLSKHKEILEGFMPGDFKYKHDDKLDKLEIEEQNCSEQEETINCFLI